MNKIIEFIYSFLIKFFRLTNKIRDKLLNLNKLLNLKINKIKTQIILFISCAIAMFIYIKFPNPLFMYILLIIGILFIMFNILSNIQIMLESVKGFFKVSGIVYIFLVLIIGLLVTSDLFKVNENIKAIIMIIILPVVWIFISCCTKTKVSILCNFILGTINGIIFAIWNFSKLYIEGIWNNLKTGIEYEKFSLIISTFLLSTTITLAITAMTCGIKKYWEEKIEEKR